MKYDRSSVIILRTPSLPKSTDFLNLTLSDVSSVVLGTGGKFSRYNDYFLAGLYLSAPEFLEGIALRLKDHSDGTGNRDLKALSTLYRYQLRASTRCTPYGTFSAISHGQIGKSTQVRLGDFSDIEFHPALSAGATDKISAAYLAFLETSKCLKVVRNSTVIMLEREFSYFHISTGQDASVFKRLSLQRDDVALIVYELAEKPILLRDLASDLAERLQPGALDITTVICKKLLEIGFLVSCDDPPLFKVHADEHFEQILETRFAGASEIAPKVSLGALNRAMKSIDFTSFCATRKGLNEHGNVLSEYLSTIRMHTGASAASGRDDFTGDAKSERIVDVVSFRRPQQCTIDSRLADRIMYSAEQLAARLAVRNPYYENLVAAFYSRFGDNPVSLLAMLDPDYGIKADDIFAAVRSGSSPPSELDAFLTRSLSRMYKFRDSGSQAAVIDLADFDPPETVADGVMAGAVHLSLRNEASESKSQVDTQVQIHGVISGSGLEMLGRFASCISSLEAATLHQLELYEKRIYPALAAELLHFEFSAHRNVAVRPQAVCRAQISLFTPAPNQHEDYEQVSVDLKDLIVHYSTGRLILYDTTSKREIFPRLTTAHNWQNPRHSNLYRLLPLLSRPVAIHFSWPKIFDEFEWLPRVVFKGMWVSPARWRMSRTAFEKVNTAPWSDKVRLFKEYAESVGMPRWILVGERDQLLSVDLEDDRTVLAACGALSPIISEMFQTPGTELVSGPDGVYNNELIIPFISRSEVAATVRNGDGFPNTSIQTEQYSPGSKWTYFRVFGVPHALEALLLGDIAKVIQLHDRQPSGLKWFFIRYSEGGDHLRLRLCSSLSSPLFEQLKDLLDDSVKRYRVHRWELASYEPEIFRYGGESCIEAAEEVFNRDSEFSLRALPLLNEIPLAKRDELALAGAIISLIGLVRDFDVDEGTTMKILDRWTRISRSKDANERVRKALSSPTFGMSHIECIWDGRHLEDGFMTSIRAYQAQRSIDTQQAIHRIKQSSSDGTIDRDIPGILRDFFHMSCNRLITRKAADTEKLSLQMLHRVLSIRQHRVARKIP